MKKLLAIAATLLLLPPAWSGNPAPLGFELGVATYSQVRKAMGPRTALQEGHNGYSGGKMLVGSGEKLGIPELRSVAWVFGTDQRLVATILTFAGRSTAFRDNYAKLAGQYTVKEKRLNRNDGGYALFQHGDSLVELSVPSAESGVTVGYITRDFMAASKRIQDADKRLKDDYRADQG